MNVRTALQTPVMITPIPVGIGDYGDVGPFLLHSREQFAAKIAQFPRGTQFRSPPVSRVMKIRGYGSSAPGRFAPCSTRQEWN